MKEVLIGIGIAFSVAGATVLIIPWALILFERYLDWLDKVNRS